jgi:DNA-binding NtrC family response regulator
MPGDMVGRCAAMERLFLQMRYLAGHLRIASIEGERGSGRRTVAEILHRLSPAREEAFLSAPASELMRGPELARQLTRLGGGTLYLEQVDALDAAGQELLLRLLRWVRGGCGVPESIRVALPAGDAAEKAGAAGLGSAAGLRCVDRPPRAVLVSSRRPLRGMAAQGRFRVDLLQQLALVQLRIPPLRERSGDLELLAGMLAAEAAARQGKDLQGVARDALELLQGQLWPGNVTELRLVMEEAVARASGDWIQGSDLRLPWGSPDDDSPGQDEDMACAGPSAEESAPTRAMQVLRSYACPAPVHDRRVAQRGLPGPVLTLRAAEAEVIARQGIGSPQRQFFGKRPKAIPDEDADPNLDRAILRHIRRVLETVRGNKLRAARLLGISRSTLYRLLDGSEGGKTK